MIYRKPTLMLIFLLAMVGSVLGQSNSSSGAFGSKTFIQEVNGDTWITANAYYDGTNWQRVDTTKTAWALSLQGTNNFPYETVQGATLWRCQPGPNPISNNYGSTAGWQVGWTVQAGGTSVFGGAGIEMDGYGTVPFGRIMHDTIGGQKYTGITSNAYVDFSGTDQNSSPSWFAGLIEDSYVVQRAPATTGVPAFDNYLQVDSLGNLQLKGGLIMKSGSGSSITFADGTTQSTAWNGSLCGGDYAESIDVSDDRRKYEPGDVLVIDPEIEGKFLKSSKPYSMTVAGIYSTKPGVLGRRQTTAKSPDEIPMAVVGIVPAKVSAENGAIRPGDVLVTSSTPGFAMKGTDRSLLSGAIVGKAMGSLTSGTGVIEVLVSLQ